MSIKVTKVKVLIGCEYSGIVRDAFLNEGHDAWSCDLLPCESPKNHHNKTYRHYEEDIFKVLERDSDWDLLICHPPCTHLSVSGARWFPPHTKQDEPGHKPLYLRFDALSFVDRLLRLDIPMICLENPVSVISSQIRKPNQTIQPYHFGHLETKKTCLWLKNLPLLKHTNNVKKETLKLPYKVRSRVHWMGSGKGKERSKFFPGIAEAMAKQWGGLTNE